MFEAHIVGFVLIRDRKRIGEGAEFTDGRCVALVDGLNGVMTFDSRKQLIQELDVLLQEVING